MATTEGATTMTTTEHTTVADLAAAVRNGDPVWRGFTADELKQVFDMVKPLGDWKAPIAVFVEGIQVTAAVAAIQWYTGTDPTVSYVPTNWPTAWLIESEGYRAGPCGDH